MSGCLGSNCSSASDSVFLLMCVLRDSHDGTRIWSLPPMCEVWNTVPASGLDLAYLRLLQAFEEWASEWKISAPVSLPFKLIKIMITVFKIIFLKMIAVSQWSATFCELWLQSKKQTETKYRAVLVCPWNEWSMWPILHACLHHNWGTIGRELCADPGSPGWWKGGQIKMTSLCGWFPVCLYTKL